MAHPHRRKQFIIVTLFLAYLIGDTAQFVASLICTKNNRKNYGRDVKSTFIISYLKDEASKHDIDYQSDSSKYDRGDMHLSADLDERDVVVYQTGTWEVDGVEVGDGNPATFQFCAVETMQIVWTHNCEHGFIRGLAVDVDAENSKVTVLYPLQFVDFGPEQLVARLPISWMNDKEATLLVNLPSDLQNL